MRSWVWINPLWAPGLGFATFLCLVQLCCPWNVLQGKIGSSGSSRRFSVCLPGLSNTDIYPAASQTSEKETKFLESPREPTGNASEFGFQRDSVQRLQMTKTTPLEVWSQQKQGRRWKMIPKSCWESLSMLYKRCCCSQQRSSDHFMFSEIQFIPSHRA